MRGVPAHEPGRVHTVRSPDHGVLDVGGHVKQGKQDVVYAWHNRRLYPFLSDPQIDRLAGPTPSSDALRRTLADSPSGKDTPAKTKWEPRTESLLIKQRTKRTNPNKPDTCVTFRPAHHHPNSTNGLMTISPTYLPPTKSSRQPGIKNIPPSTQIKATQFFLLLFPRTQTTTNFCYTPPAGWRTRQ